MRIQKRLLLIPAALVLAGVTGFGYVHASGHTTQPAISAQNDPNTADVQQGDQTTPDVAGAAENPDTAEATTSGSGAEATTPDTDTLQQGDQTGPDTGP